MVKKTQVPGQLAGKMEWLVARYPKPHGGFIFLGSILTDPEDPETSLNRKTGPVEPIPEEDKIDDSVAIQRGIHSELSTNVKALLNVAPPGSPLHSAGIKSEGSTSDEIKTTVDAMKATAQIFLPEKDYMQRVLEDDKIAAWAKAGAWSESLYMIVGVATAENLSLSEERSREKSLAASAHVSVPGAGVKLAGELSGGTRASGDSTVKIENATDFAYRVREFVYSKQLFRQSRKLKEKGDRVEGAMFSKEIGSARESDDEDFVPIFEDWVDEDEEVAGLPSLRT